MLNNRLCYFVVEELVSEKLSRQAARGEVDRLEGLMESIGLRAEDRQQLLQQGYIRSGHIRSGHIRSGHIRSGHSISEAIPES